MDIDRTENNGRMGGKPLKLHLGCGERYLEGYVNIDYPSSEHSVQSHSVADVYADLRGLCYPAASVQEVRLHHVFEHFPRPQAAGMVRAWARWLEPGGRLLIEVPDFSGSARLALAWWRSRAARTAALRHIFGSHEAGWAVHCEGWTDASLRRLLEGQGFRVRSVMKQRWKSIRNVTVEAVKDRDLDQAASGRAVSIFFRDYMIDQSETEQRLLAVWMGLFEKQASAGGGL